LPATRAADEEVVEQIALWDHLLHLGGEAQLHRTLHGGLFLTAESINDQRSQREEHRIPDGRHRIALDTADRVDCDAHPRLQGTERFRTGQFGAPGCDQAAYFRPAHALTAGKEIGQLFDDEQLLGVYLVHAAGQIGAEHADAASVKFQHRTFASTRAVKRSAATPPCCCDIPCMHASGKKGLEDKSLRLATVQTRKINGESKLDPDRPGIPHPAFLVRINIETDAQCLG